MVKRTKIHRLTFAITPNANGYVVVCKEIPSLFTNADSVLEIDLIVRNLIYEHIRNFPDDAQRRGIDENVDIQTIWRATPNSVALE